MELVLLAEAQNATFDKEYHSPEELNRKIAIIRDRFPAGEINILDIGGGNGVFLDALLAAFPAAEGHIVDISQHLLSRNQSNPRKHLIHGSIADLPNLLPDRTFDVITVNWVFHHLVGASYAASLSNQITTLKMLSRMLSEHGILVVAENMIDGYFKTDLPSRIIFGLTTVRNQTFVRAIERYFHTAGVGVCFHSQRRWEALFNRAALSLRHTDIGPIWPRKLKGKFLFLFLFLRSERHGHFVLTAS